MGEAIDVIESDINNEKLKKDREACGEIASAVNDRILKLLKVSNINSLQEHYVNFALLNTVTDEEIEGARLFLNYIITQERK